MKLVTPWISVAATTAPTSTASSPYCRFPSTSSIEVLGRRRQHQPAQPVDDHQQEAQRQQFPARLDQLPYVRQEGAQPLRCHRFYLGVTEIGRESVQFLGCSKLDIWWPIFV